MYSDNIPLLKSNKTSSKGPVPGAGEYRKLAFGPLLRAMADSFGDTDGEQNRAPIQMWETFLRFAQTNRIAQILSATLFDPAWYADAHRIPTLGGDSELATFDHYLGVGVAQGHDPTSWFSERFYRDTYSDVRNGIAVGRWRCGYQHYLFRGMAEHRSPSAEFNELSYLGCNSDVLVKVRSGQLPSGFLHYACFGKSEGRSFLLRSPKSLLALPVVPEIGAMAPNAAFAEALYLAAHTDVRPDGAPMPGMRHWLSYGLQEDVNGSRRRISRYVENLYLRNNTDVAQSVGSGSLPTGYHHFLMYGSSEKRSWAGDEWMRQERRHLARALSIRSRAPQNAAEKPCPLISIIVPVYNPETSALSECIDSVRAQTYPNWELCLVDDGSYQPESVETLLAAEREDPRIKVVISACNGGISAASNLALVRCSGDFVALLDHDDTLAPDALRHVVEAFMSGRDVDLVYTDEAKLTEDGIPTEINPKPGWSPELLLSTMYIGHLTAYRRSVINQLGGFRSRFDGSQDYDLALRAAEVVRAVVHVPLPLYFWRMSSSSTAGSLGAKAGVLNVQRQAIESALVRRRWSGAVQPGHSPGHWNVRLDVPEEMPLVSIVIPTAGLKATIGGTEFDLLVNCIRSIEQSETYPNYEFVVVHNDDLGAETLVDLAAVQNLRLVVYRSDSFNLADKINLGVESAAGQFVLLLNDDMQAESTGMIRSMIGKMFEGVGIVGARLLYANGTLQHAGVIWTAEGPTHAMIGEQRLISGPAERLRIMHNCFGVSGACMFFRRGVFLEMGGFSSRLPTNYNDVDFCLKVRAHGLRIIFNPDVTLYHFESLSKSGTHFWELQLLLLSYRNITDPFFNSTFLSRSPFYELRNPDTAELLSYRAWLVRRISQRQTTLVSSKEIRFSFILSVYQTRKYQLEELEATISNQTYDNWEWVIVDNGSTLPETVEWLKRMSQRDKVRFIRLDANQGIIGGYGAAFRASTGDYVVPVDGDDFLMLDCLKALAAAIEADDYPEALYSDEDKSTEHGQTHSPFLKPDWDPVLFTNICYVCHACAIKRSAAAAVHAYTDDGATWCHDWDTFLRILRAGGRIVHVPELLYSWRIHAGSTASIETGNKPHTTTSQKLVLEQHLHLTGLDRDFDLVQNERFPHNGIWRLRPHLGERKCSAILVIASSDVNQVWNLLRGISRAMEPGTLILIVDGVGSPDIPLADPPQELKQMLGHKNFKRITQKRCLSDALALCTKEGHRTVAVVDAGVGSLSDDWLIEGGGMFAFESDVAAVCGEVLLPDQRVAWRGGFRGFGAMVGSPDYGRAQTDSGYHGMGWCQRTCDAIPSVCFFARTDLLLAAATKLTGRPLSIRELAGEISTAIWEAHLRIIYTPFVQVGLLQHVAVDPILPDRATSLTQGRRYYPAAFGHTLKTAYTLMA